jgi:hypothetical protein
LTRWTKFQNVIAGLDPAISFRGVADARVKPAHDEKETAACQLPTVIAGLDPAISFRI